MLSGPVTLSRTVPEVEVVFEVADLVRAFETELILEPEPLLLVGFSAEAVAEKLAPLRDTLEVAPIDATFEFGEDDTITIVPGHPGTIIDSDLAAEALLQAALSVSRTGRMPFEEGAEPEVTTEELEALGITGLVSKASTSHPCCQPRVDNIHLFADFVDGTIVLPGESLSLNELVGERTTDRGFKPAPTIIGGKIIDTVGGGVSQFATTFYNAVFWGGYEDVTHTPHSYYFSRLPGRHRGDDLLAAAEPGVPQRHRRRGPDQDRVRRHHHHRQVLRRQRGPNGRGRRLGTVRLHRAEHRLDRQSGPRARRARGERHRPGRMVGDGDPHDHRKRRDRPRAILGGAVQGTAVGDPGASVHDSRRRGRLHGRRVPGAGDHDDGHNGSTDDEHHWAVAGRVSVPHFSFDRLACAAPLPAPPDSPHLAVRGE